MVSPYVQGSFPTFNQGVPGSNPGGLTKSLKDLAHSWAGRISQKMPLGIAWEDNAIEGSSWTLSILIVQL